MQEYNFMAIPDNFQAVMDLFEAKLGQKWSVEDMKMHPHTWKKCVQELEALSKKYHIIQKEHPVDTEQPSIDVKKLIHEGRYFNESGQTSVKATGE